MVVRGKAEGEAGEEWEVVRGMEEGKGGDRKKEE